MFCQNCGNKLEEGAKFCGECGAKIAAGPPRCKNCGTELAEGVKFCAECGTETAASAPPAAVPAAASIAAWEAMPTEAAEPAAEDQNLPVPAREGNALVAVVGEKNAAAVTNVIGVKNSKLLTAAVGLVAVLDGVTDKSLPYEIADIIKLHAKGATAASVASTVATTWLPGAGGPALMVVEIGFVWTMFVRLNKKINLTMSKPLLKTLGAGLIAQLAPMAAGILVLGAALSFIPGGSIAAAALEAATTYAATIASGFVYLKVLTKLFKEGKDPSTLSADALKGAVNEVIKNENMKEVLREAKEDYKRAKESGELDKKETVELEEE
jgi:uncharacterized protein (DUF697 family)